MVKHSIRGLVLSAIVLGVAPGSDARISPDAAIRAALQAAAPGQDTDDIAGSSSSGAVVAWTQTSPGAFAYSMFSVDAQGFAAATSAAQLRYTFESARAGTTPLAAQTNVTPSLDAMGTAVFERGGVREKYVALPGGVEQLFEIPSIPAAGDLVVRGTMTGTAAFDPARSDGALMTFGPFTFSGAVAYDAAGQSTALAMTHAAGGLEITVPAAWLATAALPVTIDPFVTATTPFDTPATSPNAPFRGIDIAYNATANEYFILYSYAPTASTGDLDVFGRRINAATGAPIGAVIAVETGATSDAREPAVAWNSANNTYLAVFLHTPFPYTTATPIYHVRGRVLNAAGADTGGGLLDLSGLSTTITEIWPDVAFSGTNYLVVWGRQNATFDIQGRIISAAGAGVGAAFLVDGDGDDSRRPCCAFLGTTYIAAWSDATTTTTMGAIRARTVSTAGALGAINTISTDATLDHDWAHMTANTASSECLIVWDSGTVRNNGPYGTPSTALNFRRVSAAAVGLGAAQVNIVTGTTGSGVADVAWSDVDNEYVIVWANGPSSVDTTVLLARVDGGTDTILENNTLVSSFAGSDEHLPAIAARTGTRECLIGWARVTPGTTLNISWYERIFQTSVPPPGGGGAGSTGRDNPNGDQLFNDTLCGKGAAAAAGPAWLALGLAALLLLAARR